MKDLLLPVGFPFYIDLLLFRALIKQQMKKSMLAMFMRAQGINVKEA